ncbi:MAG: cupredoxin domain-containing protein [Burkholderiales bacterium]
MNFRSLARFAGFALAATLVVAAPLASAQEMVELTVVAKGGKLEPAELAAPAGKKIRITVRNEEKKAIEFESKPLKVEKVLAPGATATVNVAPLKAGEYVFVDEFNEKNARGKLVVK